MNRYIVARLKEIKSVTDKYNNDNISPSITRDMLITELTRINDIASGKVYYDYESQKWIT